MIRPKKVIVTSNWHPKEIWDDVGTLGPILRRYQVIFFEAPPEEERQPAEKKRKYWKDTQAPSPLDFGAWPPSPLSYGVPAPVMPITPQVLTALPGEAPHIRMTEGQRMFETFCPYSRPIQND